MKKMSDLFTDEEKNQLSYLGSMLRRESTEEEAEQQKILDSFIEHGVDGHVANANRQDEDVEKGTD